MIVKLVEIRDEGTTVPAVAIMTAAASKAELWLLQRSGYVGGLFILLARIDGAADRRLEYSPEEWGSRTMTVAHRWLERHFDEIESGAVVDVQFILGETAAPKRSDRFREVTA